MKTLTLNEKAFFKLPVKGVLLASVLMAGFFMTGCNPSSDDPIEPYRNPNLVYEGWWMQYDNLTHFGHDGEPYESENFVMYSDSCSLEEKQREAAVLEVLFIELMDLLQVSSKDEFIYSTPDRKLHIYLSVHLRFPWGGGFMDTYGFMLYSRDSPRHNWPNEAYDMILKHELMHVVGGLLSNGIRGDAWFIEGIAENVSDLSGMWSRVTTRSEVEDWMAKYQGTTYNGNPIAIHTYDDIYESNPNATAEWDPYFELAVRYLLAPQGYGATWLDVKNIFLDMRQGLTFEQAFLNRLGMTLDYYESNFFALILDYLTQPQTITF
jgi:hypothetical protein